MLSDFVINALLIILGVSTLVTILFLTLRGCWGSRYIKGLFFRLVNYNKLPHEIHPDLRYWEKGDKLNFKVHGGEYDKTDNYYFQGFLEDGFVISTTDYKVLDNIFYHKKAREFAFYKNPSAVTRREKIETEKLKYHLANSAYSAMVTESQLTQREAVKLLEKGE